VKLDRIAGKSNQNLYRHPVSGIIYFCLSKKGKGRIQRSTGTDSLNEARRKADDIRYEFLGLRSPRLGRKLIKELFPEWLEQKKILRPRTWARYRLSWDHLKPFIESFNPEDITKKWWETEYIPAKRRESKTYRFFNDRKALRSFLISLKDEGVLATIPKFTNPDPVSTVGKVYSDDEISRLLENAADDLRLQILMALTMFMRKGEILLLSIDRVDRIERTVRLGSDDTKTKKPREFAISDVVWEMLRIRLSHPSGYVFPSRTGEAKPVGVSGNQSAWEGCKKRAKVRGRFHDLRHTALTKAFKVSGSNAALICFAAGLSLEEAQRTYLHFRAQDTGAVVNLVEVDA
jgi:integrase